MRPSQLPNMESSRGKELTLTLFFLPIDSLIEHKHSHYAAECGEKLLYFQWFQHCFHLILPKSLCVRRLSTGHWTLTTCWGFPFRWLRASTFWLPKMWVIVPQALRVETSRTENAADSLQQQLWWHPKKSWQSTKSLLVSEKRKSICMKKWSRT